VLAAALIAGLLCGIGMLFLIIPGIIIFVGLAVSTPALVLENLGARAALSRSWMLTRGHRKRIFNSIAVAFLLMSIPMFALGGYAASRMAEDPTLGVVVSTEALVLNAVAAFLAALMRPLFYCLLTVVYYDLRVRKEAYDLELLAGGQVAP
jgi:hypothetical protein